MALSHILFTELYSFLDVQPNGLPRPENILFFFFFFAVLVPLSGSKPFIAFSLLSHGTAQCKTISACVN